MAKDYQIKVAFDSEKSGTEEREAIVERSTNEFNGNINIEKWESRAETDLSIEGETINLAIATLAVNGTDTLLSLYQLLKTSAPAAIHRITGEAQNGDGISTYSADEVTQEIIEANDVTVIGKVEGDVIIKDGPLYPKEMAERQNDKDEEE